MSCKEYKVSLNVKYILKSVTLMNFASTVLKFKLKRNLSINQIVIE
jgi:hypothetical protein